MKHFFHFVFCAYFLQVARSNYCGTYPGEAFNRSIIVGNWTAVYSTDNTIKCQFLDIARYYPNGVKDTIRGYTNRIWQSYKCEDTDKCCGGKLAGAVLGSDLIKQRDEVYDCTCAECTGEQSTLGDLLRMIACSHHCGKKEDCYWGGSSMNITICKKETPCYGPLELPFPRDLENIEIPKTDYCNYMIIQWYYLLGGTKTEIYVRDLCNITAAQEALTIAKNMCPGEMFYSSDDADCTYCYRSQFLLRPQCP